MGCYFPCKISVYFPKSEKSRTFILYFCLQKLPLQEIRNTMPQSPAPFTLNLGGRLFTLDRPVVMGILNVTPDSFYEGSRTPSSQPEAIRHRVRQIVDEGGQMIDIGAYSTRPGASEVSPHEEMERLKSALQVVHEEAPEAIISIDTFRADVAQSCVEQLGAHLINDISGGDLDKGMFRTVARLGVPYVLMHMQGTPDTMQVAPHYDNVVAEVLEHLARRVQKLRDCGGKDIIIDPGFGFGKTLEHNYRLMERLEDFHELELPLLVGISRKSMIYRLLHTSPQEALNGTTVLNTIALLRGAHILRVHDVKAAVEACRIVEKMREEN